MSSLLSYVTYKYVILKDSRLGMAYYVLAVAIVLYTMSEIVFSKGYLEIDTNPQGVVRVMVSDDFANESFDPTLLPYCNNITCQYKDPQELNWPMEGRAVTIMTFAKDKVQRSIGQSNSPQDEYDIVKESHYYTQAPEYIIIKVDHAVVASRFINHKGHEQLAASKRQMTGYLNSIDGKMIRKLSVPGKPDKVTLQELLLAGGVAGLDVKSDAINAKGQNIRQRGAVLRVSIYYQNWFNTWFGTSDIEYTYHVRHIPYMDYNCKQVLPYSSSESTTSTDQWRLLRKRYAIRVEFEQSGSLGLFSFSTLLLKLVSGIGLLTLTATIIDTIALNLLPNRALYRQHVYDESDDIKKHT